MCMDGDFTLATAKTMNESKGQDVHEQANFGTVRQDILAMRDRRQVEQPE